MTYDQLVQSIKLQREIAITALGKSLRESEGGDSENIHTAGQIDALSGLLEIIAVATEMEAKKAESDGKPVMVSDGVQFVRCRPHPVFPGTVLMSGQNAAGIMEGLEMADAALSGANMNMMAVNRAVKAGIEIARGLQGQAEVGE